LELATPEGIATTDQVEHTEKEEIWNTIYHKSTKNFLATNSTNKYKEIAKFNNSDIECTFDQLFRT